jgi:gamma-glutamyltranspeptidase/glutathione hydrolase
MLTQPQIPVDNLNAVTVPGSAAGLLKTIETYGSGKLSVAEIFEPAIRMGREGVPTHEINANQWMKSEKLIKNASDNWREWVVPFSEAV